MQKILVIEDDTEVQMAVQRVFEGAGFEVERRDDGASGLEAFRAVKPNAIIVDLGLPGRSGKDLCRDFKATFPSIPVVVLSAVADVSDKVLLLELGADDYVTKPFSPRELLARVQAALRRSISPSNRTDSIVFGRVAVDFAKMELARDGRAVALTPREFQLLHFMVKNPERVISREEILNQVWGYANYPSTRTVDNHVLRLRHKIEDDPTTPKHLKTVHAAGYKFVM